jgi:hypothetical protein
MNTPIYSAGARYERAAMRAHLERMVKKWPEDSSYVVMLRWIRGRQSRYDKRPGGL